VAAAERDDPALDNNVVEGEFTVELWADLAVRASVDPSVVPGARIAVTIDVENRGPSDALEVDVVFDMPPAGLVVEGCEQDEMRDTVCLLGGVHVGEEATLVVTMIAADDAFGTFSIPVSLRSSAAPTGDDADHTTLLVIEVAPLEVSDSEGCEGCESSFATGSGLPALLLFAIAIRRRRGRLGL
jgi:hypothetical protein